MRKNNFKIGIAMIGILQLLSTSQSTAQTWSTVGTGTNGVVTSLADHSSGIVAGGQFTQASGNTANYVAIWNGTQWSAMGSCSVPNYYCGVSSQVYCLTTDGDLYAGGNFTTAEGSSAPYLAKWDGTSWTSINSYYPSSSVLASTIDGSYLVIGGNFIDITNGFSNTTVNYIAEWNVTSSYWNTIGTGMNGQVTALAVYGGNLYAGGNFTTAGGNTADYIAKWNGTSWSAVGTGMNGNVLALMSFGGDLYAAGAFSTAGGNTANRIAKWNGTSWSAVGTGMNSTINALATDGTNVYAGGNFTTAGGNTTNYIAYWNGTAWGSLGTGTANGTNATVNTLMVDGGNIWVGGNFSKAGGNTANYVAKFGITLLSPFKPGNKTNVSMVDAKIFPNPSNGSFSISLENGSTNDLVEVYNMLGERVYQSQLTGNLTQINLSRQSTGLYLYRVLDKNYNILSTGKLMIQ